MGVRFGDRGNCKLPLSLWMSWMGPILSLSYKPDLWSLKRPFSLSDVIYEVREISARENVESRVDSFSRRVEDIFLRTNGTIRLTGFHYGEKSCKNYISHAFLSSLFANYRPRDFFAAFLAVFRCHFLFTLFATVCKSQFLPGVKLWCQQALQKNSVMVFFRNTKIASRKKCDNETGKESAASFSKPQISSLVDLLLWR